jgi:hypothetical protein
MPPMAGLSNQFPRNPVVPKIYPQNVTACDSFAIKDVFDPAEMEPEISRIQGSSIIPRLNVSYPTFSRRAWGLAVSTLLIGALAGLALSPTLGVRDQARRIRLKLGLTEASRTPGQWNRIQLDRSDLNLNRHQRAEAERLRSLGYVGGSVPAAGSSGVTFLASGLASSSLRYYTSGHAPVAYLMDASGHIRHSWQCSYQETLARCGDKADQFLEDRSGATDCWRRARVLKDGGLLAIFEGHGLIRLDRDSRLLWAYPGACHHDLDLSPDGKIHVLTREPVLVPRIHPEEPVLLDFISTLSADGEFLDRIDILAAFEGSVYASCLDQVAASGDILHTNTLERLDGSLAHRSPVFREGNFLISIRELNTIAIVDAETRLVVWALSGMWMAQHQPTLLANGHLLLFDNKGCLGRSKVLEIDPLSQAIHWMYEDRPGRPLFSALCGSAQRLANGNTLITESDNGRALEVNPEKAIVWEYRNPRRTGKHDEFIAAILEMVILPADFPVDWLELAARDHL